jgi:hypothetical protein
MSDDRYDKLLSVAMNEKQKSPENENNKDPNKYFETVR